MALALRAIRACPRHRHHGDPVRPRGMVVPEADQRVRGRARRGGGPKGAIGLCPWLYLPEQFTRDNKQKNIPDTCCPLPGVRGSGWEMWGLWSVGGGEEVARP